MPDITMCRDQECPIRESCHRFTATPTPNWQAYFLGTPRETKDSCPHFWSNEDRKPAKRNP